MNKSMEYSDNTELETLLPEKSIVKGIWLRRITWTAVGFTMIVLLALISGSIVCNVNRCNCIGKYRDQYASRFLQDRTLTPYRFKLDLVEQIGKAHPFYYFVYCNCEDQLKANHNLQEAIFLVCEKIWDEYYHLNNALKKKTEELYDSLGCKLQS